MPIESAMSDMVASTSAQGRPLIDDRVRGAFEVGNRIRGVTAYHPILLVANSDSIADQRASGVAR